jgi:hypothetical protein
MVAEKGAPRFVNILLSVLSENCVSPSSLTVIRNTMSSWLIATLASGCSWQMLSVFSHLTDIFWRSFFVGGGRSTANQAENKPEHKTNGKTEVECGVHRFT